MKASTLSILMACFVFSACQTGPVTQARIEAAPNFWADTWETIDARKCNKEFGLRLGTPEFGDCMLKLNANRTASFNSINQTQQLLQQNSQWKSYGGTSSTSVPSTLSNGGQLQGTTVSGQMRYCTYNNMGQTVIVTISRFETCPYTN